MGWLRTLGVTEERRPFRDKLWAWWVYAAVGAVGLVTGALMLAGFGSADPDRARLVAWVFVLPMSLCAVLYAVLAYRHQRR